MLRAVTTLAGQWNALQAELGEDWVDARVRLRFAKPEEVARGVALLGPLNPVRSGEEVTLFVVRHGPGVHPHQLARALERLDREKIRGALELPAVTRGEAVAAPEPAAAATLAEQWDALLATLPPDWSDLLVELELDSSDYIAPASLRLTPVNARRTETGRTLLFRVARTHGYGAAPAMTRRCLERCDEDGIRGTLRVVNVLSSTHNVQTQGPVWHLAGRTV
jgi:hypothetical protein